MSRGEKKYFFSHKMRHLIELIIEAKKSNSQASAALSYESWAEKITIYLKFLERLQLENKKDFSRKLKFEGERLDLILVQHLILYLILIPFADVRKQNFKGLKKDSLSFQALRTCTFLLNNAINNLYSIKMLALMGMDSQARIILRNYIEGTDIAIAVLLDDKFLQLYTKETSDDKDAKDKWRETRPSKIQHIIKAAVEKNKKIKEIWEFVLPVRKEYYDISSMVTHANIMPVFLENYPTILNTDMARIGGVGGCISEATSGMLISTLEYASFAINFIQYILESHHGMEELFGRKLKDSLYHSIKETNMLIWLYCKYPFPKTVSG